VKTAQATVHDRIEEEDTAANVFEEDIGDRVVLKTSLTNCVMCKVGNIVPKNRGEKEAMLVYGRSGTYRAIHEEFNCNNQNSKCGTSYFFSFYKHGGKKVYYNDALKKKQLVGSAQTAFDVDYLYELSNLVEQCSANFEALAKVYNRMHCPKLPMDVIYRREELCRKRMTGAYMLYAYLELGSRYGIKNYQVIVALVLLFILNVKRQSLHLFLL
jgi:hypothetical protein